MMTQPVDSLFHEETASPVAHPVVIPSSDLFRETKGIRHDGEFATPDPFRHGGVHAMPISRRPQGFPQLYQGIQVG